MPYAFRSSRSVRPLLGQVFSQNFPLSADDSGIFFKSASNSPFLIHGESAWLWASEPSVASQTTYLADRASRGVNAIYVQAISRPTDHAAGSNADGDFAFTTHTSTTADFSTYNPIYFNKVRDFVRLAASFGIIVFLAPCYLGFSGAIADGWASVLAAQSAAVAQAYGAAIATTMLGEPNIVWLIGGDNTPSGTTLSRQESMVAGIRSVDPSRLMTGHWDQSGMPTSSQTVPWADFGSGLRIDAAYTWSGTPYTQTAGVYGLGAPALLLEAKYENNDVFGWTPLLIRQQLWNCFLSGGLGGNFYGNEQIWPAGSTNTNPQSGPNWQAHLTDPGIMWQKYWHDLMVSTNSWHLLVPDVGNSLVTAGRQTLGSANYVEAAKTPNGRFAFAYVPSNNAITIALSQMAGPSVVAKWFDPTNNSLVAASGSPFSASGTHSFPTPGNNSLGDPDWVLFLTS